MHRTRRFLLPFIVGLLLLLQAAVVDAAPVPSSSSAQTATVASWGGYWTWNGHQWVWTWVRNNPGSGWRVS